MFFGCSFFQQPLLEQLFQQSLLQQFQQQLVKHKISFSGWASPNPVGLNYKGAKKSHLSSGQVTEVIVSLLVAAGIDPVRVQHDAEDEDNQPPEG